MDGSLSRPGQPRAGATDAAAERSSIVSCQQCGARYKLDEGRISGRGAKITCPKCRNVFVVRRDASGKLSTGTAGSEAEGAGTPPTGAPVASSSPWEVKPPSGEPELPRVPAPAAAPAVAPLDVHSLDFRRVGIQSWKVKVKIGLVYDFSDFRTLSKYINEGRITPADRISHKAGEWTLISDISSLEQHFIEVYRGAEAAILAAQAPAAEGTKGAEDYESDEPTNIVGMEGMSKPGAEITNEVPKASPSKPTTLPAARPAPSAEAAAALAAMSTGNPTADTRQFHDPFEKNSEKKGQKGAKKPAPRASGSARPDATLPPRASAEAKALSKGTVAAGGIGLGLVAVVLLLALVGGGGLVWFFYLREVPPPSSGVTSAPVPPPADGGGRAEVIKQIETSAKPVEPATAEEDDWGVDEEPVLIPVGPRGSGTPRSVSGTSSGGSSSRSTNPSTASSGSSSAADHAAVGDDAARSRDWAGAAAAYRNAVAADPRNATYAYKYGEALFRSGDVSGATAALTKATQLGSNKAWRLLGDIARDQGDAAGAISAYQKYLQSGPSDAAQVQAEIDKLQKG